MVGFREPTPHCAYPYASHDIPAEQTTKVLIKLAYAFLYAGDIENAKAGFEVALEECFRQESMNYEDQVWILLGLGSLALALKENDEALEYLNEAKSVLSSFEAQDNSTLAQLTSLFAVLYKATKKYTEALSYAEKTLSIQLEICSEGDARLGRAYQNLAAIHHEMNDLDKAEINYVKAIECFGKDPNSTKESENAFDSLVEVFCQKKKHSEVTQFLEKAAQDAETKDIAQAAQIYIDLGQVYLNVRNLEKASVNLLKGVQLLEQDPNSDMTILRKAYLQLGVTATQKKDSAEAAKYFEKGLGIESQVTNETVKLYCYLGGLWRKTRDIEKSKDSYMKALEYFEKDANADRDVLPSIYYSLAGLLCEEQKFVEAVNYYEKQIQELDTKPEVKPLVKGHIFCCIAECYAKARAFNKVVPSYLKAIDCCLQDKPATKEDKSEAFDFLQDIVLTLTKLNQQPATIPGLLRCVELKKELGLEQSKETASLYVLLGDAYSHTGDLESSLKSAECALKIYEEVQGKDHMDVAAARRCMGLTLQMMKRLPEAEENLKEAERIYKATCGEDHRYTCRIKMYLEQIALEKQEQK